MRSNFELGGRPLSAGALLVGLCVGIHTGCGGGVRPAGPIQSPTLTEEALAARSGGGETLFQQLTPAECGIDLENRFEWGHALEHLYPHGFAGGGVAIGDYDEDGLPDVYLTSQTGRDRLYRNLGGMQFEDASDKAGLHDESDWGAGAAFADFDGDQDLDLYVCNYGAPNRLWRNLGNGRFEECAAEVGVDFSGASVMVAFADYDCDGDLDFYLLTNRLYPGGALDEPRLENVGGKTALAAGQEEAFAMQERKIGGEVQKFVIKAGERDRLYQNDGRGRFREVGAAAGMLGNHPGLSATWWDYDEDGWPDLYVGNDFWDPDYLYRNLSNGQFRDVAREVLPHTTWFSMGADAADVDGDGRIDFLSADMAPTSHYMGKLMMGDMNESRWFLESAEPRQYMRNALYLATGTQRFQEVGFLAGLAQTDWTWSPKFGDFDCDGDNDLYLTNGTANHSFDPDLTRAMNALAADPKYALSSDPLALRKAQWALYREKPPRAEKNLAFENLGGLRFERAEDRYGLGQETISFGAALSDLDRDGDLDLVVNDVGAPARVYENRSSKGHAVLLRLPCNRDGFGTGARVVAEFGGKRIVRANFPTAGYMSANEPLVHLGLGEHTRIERLSVRWPSGRMLVLSDLAADRCYTLRESGARTGWREASATPLFEEAFGRSGLNWKATAEVPYDDYQREPLLPQKLSQPGPGIACADVDGDADIDLFVGGSAGQSGRLFLCTADGQFELVANGPWEQDKSCEDTAILFLDHDKDGDLDLYVGSGSVECPPLDPMLSDRLYVNQGTANFIKAEADLLPDARENTSALCAGDLDRDGDLELFVGARSIPGRYPLVPRSRLLWNENGRFVDVTEARAPGLAQAGLVTAAVMSDVDQDGQLDLLLVSEWGSPRLWRNTEGELQECSAEAGLTPFRGWWSGLCAVDLDGDLDTDYLALNAGLNTKYRASPAKPALLYYGDFEGSGKHALIEAKYGQAGELPVRGLSCSSEAMPFVREKLPTYDQFARALLNEIYEPSKLEDSLRLEVTHLESGLYWNRLRETGKLRFEFEALPLLAQAAPGQGSAVADLDADGALDVICAQNYYWREPETGRWDGGLGFWLTTEAQRMVLRGPAESGIALPGDGRAVLLLDSDGDARAEVLVTRNEDQPALFRLRAGGPHDAQRLALRLQGKAGNPQAIGARVVISGPGDERTSLEILSTNGYLSASSPWLFLRGGEGSLLQVHWPDGSMSERQVALGEQIILLDQP